MNTAAEPKLITADELLHLPYDGMRHELIHGELRTMTPAGYHHGRIVFRLTGLVWSFLENDPLGEAFGAETGFRLGNNPDTVRAPDLAFVAKERIGEVAPARGYGHGAPDLVAEVTSPGDTYEEVEEKVATWLAAGTPLVWVLNPRRRTVAVHNREGVQVLTDKDTLTGGSVLPGFACPVAELFP